MNAGTKKRLIALLTLAVCFAMLFSLCCIALGIHHDCTGDGCLICARIADIENALRGMSFAAAALSLVSAAAFSCALTNGGSCLCDQLRTPVKLKVLLLN